MILLSTAQLIDETISYQKLYFHKCILYLFEHDAKSKDLQVIRFPPSNSDPFLRTMYDCAGMKFYEICPVTSLVSCTHRKRYVHSLMCRFHWIINTNIQ